MSIEPKTPAQRFETILLLTDFSAASTRAFVHALALALACRARLDIVHVTDHEATAEDWRHYPAVRDTLERWALLPPDSPRSAVFDLLQLKVRKVALHGRKPQRATLEYLARHDADLLVLATAGRTGALRWLHPSVAEALARDVAACTLFVPAAARRGAVDEASGHLRLERVLVPVAAQPAAQAAVELARAVSALVASATVVIDLLHIGPARERPRLALPDGVVSNWIDYGAGNNIAACILAQAKTSGIDLILMTTAGRDSLGDALLGTTTERVLRGADCPVLAVPAGW